MIKKAILVVAVGLMLVVFSPLLVLAYSPTPGNFRELTHYWVDVIDWDEGFYNYDLETDTVDETRCDFPVTMLFTDFADCWKVKNVYYWGEAENHTWMWNLCREYYQQNWEWDWGTRETNDQSCSSYHMRVYAWGGSYQYNNMIGAYVIGTTHYDSIVHWPPGFFGWSEMAEDYVLSHAESQ